MSMIYEETLVVTRISRNRNPDASEDSGDVNYQSHDDVPECTWKMALGLGTIQCLEEFTDYYNKFENPYPKTIVSVYSVGDIIIVMPFDKMLAIWNNYTDKCNQIVLGQIPDIK